MSISHRVSIRNIGDLRFARDRIGVREVDLESHGDEGVSEREHEVGAHCGEPAPDDHLVEFERRVALRVDVSHVDREVEGKAEEGYDDQVWVY